MLCNRWPAGIISFISAAYYSSHMGQGQSGDSEQPRYGTPDVHHWVWLPKLLPWAATRTQGVLSVPWPPLHSRRRHSLQGQNSHTTFTPPTCPVCPPLSTSGCDLHDYPCRNNRLLARYHSCYYSLTDKLLPLQPHGTFPTQCATLSSCAISIPFQCVCADLFHYKGVHYLIVVDRYSN